MAVFLLSQLSLAGDGERGRRAISGLLLLKLKCRGVKGQGVLSSLIISKVKEQFY